jgi:hypothetical protein
MKRNWLTYVAIVAALLAGTVCSTAFADGKGGNKFKGSSNFRSLSGGGNGGGSSNLSRVKKVQGTGSFQQFQHQGSSGISSNLKKVQIQQNTSGLSNQIRTMPGTVNGIKKIDPKFSQGIGANGGLSRVNPDLTGKFKPAIVNGQTIQNSLNQNLTSKLNPAIVNGIGNGQGNLQLNPNAIKKLNPAIVGSKFCGPISNPCYNPCNKWCGPCWWWTPNFCNPCYTGCYYPTIYTYPQTIVITQPVTTVVEGAAVAPAVAIEPVAEKLMQIPIGSTVTLAGKDLGDAAGQVVVQIDKISLPAQLNEWKADSVNVTLPMLGLAGPTKAQLWMVKADGAVAANMAAELIPAKPEAPAATAAVMP